MNYLDGFQYEDNLLEFFPTSEGYVKATPMSPNPAEPQYSYNYVYNYTDHLGNLRISYAKDPQTGDLKVMEENNYYPYGLKHANYASSVSLSFQKQLDDWGVILAPVTNNPYKYKYNGKELQDELSLNMYAMDARMYDPAIARWVVMDPVIHHSMSPYNAFDNNPVFWADPSGADGESSDSGSDSGESTGITMMGIPLENMGVARIDVSGLGDGKDGKDDWIRNNKTGKITNDPNVTGEECTPEGFDYIGPKDEDIVNFLFGNDTFTASTKDVGIMGVEEENGSSAAYPFSATTSLRVMIKALISNGEFKGIYLDASVQGIHSRSYDNSIALGGTFTIQKYETSQSSLPRGANGLISTEGSVNAFGSAFFSAQSIQNNFGKSTSLNVGYKGIYGYYAGQHDWSVLTTPLYLGAIRNYTNVRLNIPMNQKVYTNVIP